MKSTQEFLADFSQLDVKLWVEGDRLCCNAPKGVLTPDRRAELAKRKTDIITFLNEANFSLPQQLAPIRPIQRDGSLPLSFAQERLWFLDQLEGGSATYSMPAAIKLDGFLNISALTAALQEILRRHEVLRTSFQTINGSPVQVIDPNPALTISIINLQTLPETEQAIIVQRLAQEDAQKSFNLSLSPLVRATLLQLGENSQVLLFNMHHIASDGWSISILLGELSTLYQAYCEGKPSSLPELPIQYADFAHWQRMWLQGEVLDNQLHYWQEQLAGIPPLLELPTDHPRPPVQTFQGNTISIEINTELTNRLNELSRSQGVTLFATLLAALKIFLFKWTGQTDIVVGTVIAGRNRSEIEPLIGCFVNFLALRSQLSDNPIVQKFLKQVGKTVLEAYSHQDLPFEKLVEFLNPARQMSHNPIYNVAFLLQNHPASSLFGNGIEVSYLKIEVPFAKLDLRFVAQETSGKILLDCEYNTDLFEAETIHRMLDNYEILLHGVVSNISQRISELSILSEAERHQLLVKWNTVHINYTQECCIHELFEQQVEQSPDAIAVVFEEKQLTYKELNTRANQLAHYLQKLGVRADVLVGICVERSLEMVVGLLGILKAGGAYVPLDPSYPPERLAHMLLDSQVSVILTQQSLLEQLPDHRANIVCFDRDWALISQCPEENLKTGVEPQNLIYVIYTSGSTGLPKGVLLSHFNVVRLLSATRAWFEFTANDVWTLFHSYAFDFSVWELWGALCHGSKVVIVPYWVSRSPDDLYKLLSQERVTILNQTPSAFRQLIQAEESANTVLELSLRLVIFGGEALELQSLKPWFDRHGDQMPRLINMYGITETTVHVTYRPLDQSDLQRKGSLIGSPIPDLQIYLLDQYQQLVPIGVIGEMYVGGAGVARGYLNRPELTAERFITNPFSSSNASDSRLYKTGDLARYLPNGDLEYLGRIDHQVKLRGFRIELGEIESALSQHPEVRETIVIVREDEPDDKRLVAYYVPQQEGVNSSKLRQFLSQTLPDFMIPSAFVELKTMPLTPNGKLDRRGLPEPDSSGRSMEESFVAPRDPIELQLAQIWSNVLGIDSLGVRDNFFELGGNSLLAVRLFAQVQQQFGNHFSLSILFQNPTIEALTSVISRQKTYRSASSLVPIQLTGSQAPLFCIHPAGGNVLCFFDLSRELGADQPFYALQSVGLEKGFEPDVTVEAMATRYLKAIQSVQPGGPYRLIGWSFGGLVAFEMAQQLQSYGEQVTFLGLIDTQTPTLIADELGKDDAQLLVDLLEEDLELSLPYLHQLPEDEQLGYVMEQAHKINLLPPSWGLEEAHRFLSVFKANFKAAKSYFPLPYSGLIYLFQAIEPTGINGTETKMGWSQLASQGVEVCHVPGNHQTMIRQPHVKALAANIKNALALEMIEEEKIEGNPHQIDIKKGRQF